MRFCRYFVFFSLMAVLVCSCDCGGEKDKCDLEPTIYFTRPGSTVLTELKDTNPDEDGVQYPVTVRTIGVPAGTVLSLTNSLRPGETVRGEVVLEDEETQTGNVEFGDQTFVEGSNHICARGGVHVNRMVDGSSNCSSVLKDVEDCNDVVLRLGVPDCLFVDPAEADRLTATDDSSASRGFQYNVRVMCAGVDDGEVVKLIVNGRDLIPLEGTLGLGEVLWEDVDLPEGEVTLRAETTGRDGSDVEAEIGITVETGACALRVLPKDGSMFRAGDDEDPDTDGLQVTLTVETDAAGMYACAEGSTVSLFVAGDEYSGTLSGGSVAFQTTLRDGTVHVYASAQEPAGGATGESLSNRYYVCATPVVVEITAPRDGLTITDAADRDPDEAGIQVAVSGNAPGVPAAENMRLLVDGTLVTDGTDPLIPSVFFAGGNYEFQYATFALSGNYTIQVAGIDACVRDCSIDTDCDQDQNEQCIDQICMQVSPIHTVSVQTEQPTCQIDDPLNNAVLLAASDKDADESNGLQYDVRVTTENVPNGSEFTLYVSGQDSLSGLVVQNDLSVNEVTFTTVDVTSEEKTLQCVLDTGEASPAVTITVDGHSPTMEIISPADQSSFDDEDITVELLTTGVEDGVEADVVVESSANQQTFRCTVTGNTASCDVTLYSQVGVETTNTIKASVSDQAGNPSGEATITATVLVVSAPPVVTFIDPDETATQPIVIPEGNRTYDVKVQVTNLIAGAPVELVVVDNGVERTPIEVDLDGQGEANYVGVLLPRGDVQLKASATNALGTGESSVDLLVGDTTLPVVSITAPPDQTYTQQTTFDVTVNSDVEAGQMCYLCARVTPSTPSLPPDCDSAAAIAQGAADAGGDVTASITLSEDDFELWASCTNQASQTGTSIPVRVVVDLTPPTVQFTEPLEGAVYNAQSPDRSADAGFQIRVQLSADVEEGQGATLTVDGSPAAIVGAAPEFDGGQIDFSAVTVADDAAQLLGANVCDKAGNCADATPVNITIDRSAPDVTITDPVDLARLGTSADESAAVGFQIDVTCAFVDAGQGDTVVLERKVGAGTWEQVASHALTTAEASGGYTFVNATIVADDVTTNDPRDVQLRATSTDAAANNDSDQITVTVNRVAPEVTISRPTNGQNLNIFSDMGSDSGMQVQVDVETYHTQTGDLLVICTSPGTGYPEGRCTGYGREVWSGVITGIPTIAWGVNLEQGDNTLVAFAENIPGQGTYSDPVIVHADSIPPTVDSIVVTSDAPPQDGCLSQAEGGLQATVMVFGATDGRIVRLMQDWPPGVEIARAPLSGGSAVLSASLVDGDYDLTAEVTDSFGNPNILTNPEILDPEAHFSVTVDTTAPSVSISEPSKATLNLSDDLNTSTQDLDFNFIVATNAEDGQPVLFEIDTSPVGTAAVSGGAALLQAAAGQGNHTLRASVSDFCGNPATPATAGIFVDTVKPTVACSQPSDNDTFTTQQVQFSCTTTGTDSTQSITVTSTIGGERCSAAVDGSSTTTFTCTLLSGVQDLSVTVTDPAGNVSDPDAISNVNVNVAGCDVAFVGHSGLVVFNADDDNDSNPNNGLQVDLTAQSGNCDSTNCSGCRATLKLNGTPFGSALPLDSSGNVTFQNAQFQHDDAGIDVEVELNDGSGGITTDVFTVELVDLYPPQVVRDAPGSDDVTCVAFRGNPNADGLVVLSDKIDGTPCEMDFAFTVTDGGDMTYPGSFAIEQGGSPITGPTNIVNTPQMVGYTNIQLAHDATHALNVVASDYAGNQVSIPMTVEADVLAPGQVSISNSTIAHTRHADVDLTWTATGDDAGSGTATAYAIRWAHEAINDETEWGDAEEIPNTLSPGSPGTTANFTAQWLPPLNTYHLAIRAVDEVGNHGPIPSDLAVYNLWNEMNYFGPGGNFGFNVWNVGDVNNDNRDDLVVSAITLDSNAGAAYLFYGEADLDNWSNVGTPQKLTRNLGGELMGWDVCGKGDLDGDSIDDLVVSGHRVDSSRGRVSIFFGRNGSPLPDQPDVEIRGVIDASTTFGRSLEIIGDINHDGFDDLFIGAPEGDANGRGYIFFGRTRANWIAAATASDSTPHPPGSYIPVASADISIFGVDVDDWFGYRHGSTTLGDLDGDGYDEFALVASKVNEVYTFDGATVSGITTRDVNPATDSVDVISYGTPYDDGGSLGGFGIRAAGGVDFTGDGIFDLVVTASHFRKFYLLAGVDSPVEKIDPAIVTEVTWPEQINFGWDLDVADINMDGWPDIILGTNSTAGHRAFLFYNTGSSPYFNELPGTTLETGSDYYGVGTAIGDFNGDGLIDVAVGSLADILYVYY